MLVELPQPAVFLETPPTAAKTAGISQAQQAKALPAAGTSAYLSKYLGSTTDRPAGSQQSLPKF